MIRNVGRFITSKNVSHFLVLVLISALAYLVLFNVDWVLMHCGDDQQLLCSTVQGNLSHGWMGIGRLWPLGLLDYSILLIFTDAPTALHHFLFNVIVMAVSILLLFRILYRECKNWWISFFFLIILSMASGFLKIHMTCICPERFIFFLQAIYMYFWWKGSKEQSLIYYFIAWLAISYAIFTKEPVFGMVLVISLTNLIFGWDKLTQKDKIFHIAQIMSSLVFVWIYLFAFMHTNMNFRSMYGGAFSSKKDLLDTIRFFFFQEPFLLLMLLMTIARAYMILKKSDKSSLYTDSLLFGGMAYVFAYILIKINNLYYVIPSVVFALPSFAYWCGYFWKKKNNIALFAMVLCAVSMIPSVYHTQNNVLEIYECRKNDMPFVDRLVDSYLSGKKLYIFTNGASTEKFTKDDRQLITWRYRAWLIFLNYRMKKKVSYTNDNMIIPLKDLRRLPQHCMVLCPQEADQKDKDYLKSRFRFVRSAIGMDLYEN